MSDVPPWQTATLRRSTPLSPSVRELELQPEPGCTRPAPGSHLPLRLQAADGRWLERRYSLLGRSDDGLAWRIAVKRCAPSRGGSAALHALAVGAQVQVQPPQNLFAPGLRAPQHLLLAGGIGITPLIGIAQALVARGADCRLLWAVRAPADLVYLDTLHALLGERLQTFVGSQGQRLDLAGALAGLHADAQLLLCGPARMTREVQAAWQAAGRPAHRLRFETFGAVATDAEPFWVRLPRHGLAFTVPAEQTLLQALDARGVAVLRDCQRGECGLCALDVLELHGRIDHHDVVLGSDERAADRRLCACVSRVRGGGVVLDTAFRPDSA